VSDPAELRRDYAARMLRIAGVADAAVERAMACPAREDFLGPPPWTVLDHMAGSAGVESADLHALYEDVLVVLDQARGVNNGSPSLHALMLHHLGVRPGERVLHVGCGAGYYTAMLAELTGAEGRVVALEFDRHLAEAARRNLGRWRNVAVIEGDGADWPKDEFDRVYVNFGVVAPAAGWIEHLSAGGTAVFPLTTPQPRSRSEAQRHPGFGVVLACTRTTEGVAVQHLTPCNFVSAEGRLAGTTEQQSALERAFLRGGVEFVRSYRRPAPAGPERCWFWSREWALSYDVPPGGAP
jgi:protein-L-isoaspartate(D-aspartate) O-methyltransferase